MEIHFATTNPAKVKSLQRELSKHDISVIHVNLELTEPRSSEIREIAEFKIRQAFAQIQKPTVIMDAGFYIHSLQGFPRAFVNFALETVGIEGILRLVEGKSRECEFRNCLAYMDKETNEPQYFFTHAKGILAESPRGMMQSHAWSRLWLIFVPDGENKTLAEMSYDEYLHWRDSRGDAISLGEQLYGWVSTRIK